MAGYENVIFEELGLHHIRVPNRLTAPLQVQIKENGQNFGRFTLDQVFEGDFSKVAVGAPSDIANLEYTLSNAYGASAAAGAAGPLGLLNTSHARLEGKGAKRIRITSLGGVLQEADQGELLIALNQAVARPDGSLQRGRTALVITAVASVTDFAIELETELGAQVKVDAEVAKGVRADGSVMALVGRNGGLTVSSAKPVPFAVRLWTVKLPLFGSSLKIASSKRLLSVLGDGDATAQFLDDAGIRDDAVDLD